MASDSAELRQLFEDCVRGCADSLYRVAYRLTGDSTLAGELVQETYLNAWRSLEKLRQRERMKSWLFGIMQNQYYKLMRKESRAAKPTESIDESAERDDAYARQDDAEAVQFALDSLDDSWRMPILLVNMEGMSVDQAASILELPRGTVLSRLHRGREKLRQLLTRQGYSGPKP